MSLAKTRIEWTYWPTDFFEAPYRHQTSDYELEASDGRAIATLVVPRNPVDGSLQARITETVKQVFALQQLQVRRRYELDAPRVHQEWDWTGVDQGDIVGVVDLTAPPVRTAASGHVDFAVRDQAGNVRDLRAERITEQTKFINASLAKMALSVTLQAIVTSFCASINDPSNALVHLYEVRDALVEHYRKAGQEAQSQLGISANDWSWFGKLANKEPIEQGRHRGKHLGKLRSATAAELTQAQSMAYDWIVAFMNTV